MYKFFILLCGAVALSTPVFSQSAPDSPDSTASDTTTDSRQLSELVVVARRTVFKQSPDRITYLVKNDPYAPGLDALALLDRIPRISVINDIVSVAGKNSVKYLVDGRLLEMTPDAIIMKLKNLQAAGIEKIELLTTPPARYTTGDNVAYISITTRNESLGTRGSVHAGGGLSDDYRYSLGGNISHTTRRVELSADMGRNDSKGKNDFYKEYIFADHERISDRTNSFVSRSMGANALFRYKFTTDFSAGAIVNYSCLRMGSDVYDRTTDSGTQMLSTSAVPAYPDNAMTLTGFADWKIDSKGKMLSLTYNRFDKRSNSYADISTQWDDGRQSRLTKDAGNRYGIHSVKLDATLPFNSFKMEAGAAYTSISNNTELTVADVINGSSEINPAQSNHFVYSEKTAGAYLGVEKNFGLSVWGKLALRYEHTDVRGIQRADNSRHDSSYDYLFPSANVSWNMPGAGRLSADYSMGISRPQFGDMNPFRYYNTVNDYFTGNPDLKSVLIHNAGINYSYKGLYAVLYISGSRNAIGYITRFDADGMQWTTPENCLNTIKTGLYASYNRTLFDRWNLNIGAEAFYAGSTSLGTEYLNTDYSSWSGKFELNTSMMLNRSKSLILNLRCSHYLPYADKMSRYNSRTLLYCEIRYLLLNNRLTLSASVNDPFGWNVTKSRTAFADYTLCSKTDIHSHSVSLRVSWAFGRDKVSGVYRDSKERESQRSY